ncbi:hypothetical protein ES20_10135 [Rothia aeria]|uniref:DUF6318 family protein n=1 Tax=Rothia aeria TaxID=172042 RepID=UPI00051D9C87|nr:DUF6318 family protein [Rothia aeria]KGI99632.1 hypothetical protein ES20_10135 [Rothia aeria]KGJ32520.1 hypothetical protein ES18_09575 [Rothia aeria]
MGYCAQTILFNRRRALWLAGAGLGSLGLAACGGAGNAEGQSGSSSSASSDGGASGESAGSGSATPNPSFSKGYSGGSKAPEGEYRMADYRGPAQNVRVPARPDESYKVNSVEGLKKSVFAWVEWSNYGIQTGDFDVARQFVSNEFTEEVKRYDYYTKLYQEGGWIIDGIDVFEFHGDDPVMKDDGTYLWEFYLKWVKQIEVKSDGKWKPWENKRHDDDTFLLHIRHTDGGWKITGMSQVTGQKDKSEERG